MSVLHLSVARSRLAQLGPLTMISVGIIASFGSAALLCWAVVCIVNGLI